MAVGWGMPCHPSTSETCQMWAVPPKPSAALGLCNFLPRQPSQHEFLCDIFPSRLSCYASCSLTCGLSQFVFLILLFSVWCLVGVVSLERIWKLSVFLCVAPHRFRGSSCLQAHGVPCKESRVGCSFHLLVWRLRSDKSALIGNELRTQARSLRVERSHGGKELLCVVLSICCNRKYPKRVTYTEEGIPDRF